METTRDYKEPELKEFNNYKLLSLKPRKTLLCFAPNIRF